MEKRLASAEFTLPAYIMQDNILEKEAWKNIPFAVTNTLSAVYMCQENISRIVHLMMADSRRRFQLVQQHVERMNKRFVEQDRDLSNKLSGARKDIRDHERHQQSKAKAISDEFTGVLEQLAGFETRFRREQELLDARVMKFEQASLTTSINRINETIYNRFQEDFDDIHGQLQEIFENNLQAPRVVGKEACKYKNLKELIVDQTRRLVALEEEFLNMQSAQDKNYNNIKHRIKGVSDGLTQKLKAEKESLTAAINLSQQAWQFSTRKEKQEQMELHEGLKKEVEQVRAAQNSLKGLADVQKAQSASDIQKLNSRVDHLNFVTISKELEVKIQRMTEKTHQVQAQIDLRHQRFQESVSERMNQIKQAVQDQQTRHFQDTEKEINDLERRCQIFTYNEIIRKFKAIKQTLRDKGIDTILKSKRNSGATSRRQASSSDPMQLQDEDLNLKRYNSSTVSHEKFQIETTDTRSLEDQVVTEKPEEAGKSTMPSGA